MFTAMDLKTYLRTLKAAEKRDLASAVGTKVIYLIQIAGGHSRPSGQMALAIERSSGRKVTRQELRPDLYPLDTDTCEAAAVRAPEDGYRESRVPDGPPPCDEAAREPAA